MKLRKLEQRDAPLMLEWMHDQNVVEHLSSAFATKTQKDCEAFILASREDPDNWNFAITDDTDTYMGTVSLKHIDRVRGDAEFAISVRSCAMGKGLSKFAMARIIEMGFEQLGLKKIYWCVSPENKRAVRFYDKYGYSRALPEGLPVEKWYTTEQIRSYLWYCAEN